MFSQMSGRTLLRAILVFIIVMTIPCYVIGFLFLGAANRAGEDESAIETGETPTAIFDNNETQVVITNTPSLPSVTPIGIGVPTSIIVNPPPVQFWTAIPPTTRPATAVIPPTDTPAPTLTPQIDSDGDGILNHNDACPNQAGIPSRNGCPDPDRDGDGIANDNDACPDLRGVASANGCPDADGDGVRDSQDDCPNTAGTESNGCPPPDTDGDGVRDSQDACPNTAGLPLLNGCPDRDGDNVIDSEDACPDVFGDTPDGCPLPEETPEATAEATAEL